MTSKKRWAAGAILAAAWWMAAGRAQAAAGNPSYLNIDVTVNAQVSVAVNGVNSSTQTTLSWNTSSANQEFTAGTNASSATVKNDSAVAEKWYLSGSTNSVNTSGTGT